MNAPKPLAAPAWTPVSGYQDIIYAKAEEGIAKIVINRPEVRNAFRPETGVEMQAAFTDARDDPNVWRGHLPAQGKEAFCSGGDQRVRGKGRLRRRPTAYRASTCSTCSDRFALCPNLSSRWWPAMPSAAGMYCTWRCDLTIAADNARFGQTGPRVGSFSNT